MPTSHDVNRFDTNKEIERKISIQLLTIHVFLLHEYNILCFYNCFRISIRS